MKLYKLSIAVFIILFVNISVYAIVLPSVISSDLSLPAGIHTISNSSIVEVGVTLTFSPVSTLQFVNVDSQLKILGNLKANETTFTGDTPAGKWGQILCEPGSESTLLNCLIDNGGGNSLPPPPLSNAMFYAVGANITISNTVATRPQGDSFGFEGGNITFVDNVAIAAKPPYGIYAAAAIYGSKDWPTAWQSSGNILTGSQHQGIWLDGDFTKDLSISAQDARFNVNRVSISNCTFTISKGTQLGFYDYSPGILTLKNNGILMANGTEALPIGFYNFFDINPWLIKLLAGSKAYFNHAVIFRPSSFSLTNAYICLSNTFVLKLENGMDVNHESEICAFGTTFSGMVNKGVMIRNSSTANLRECSFENNNPPFVSSLSIDETSSADARYCWWDAADGPYPYGPHGNEIIVTNANVKCFPWLIAAPGSQTNPPSISITSHSGEPIVVSSPQILLKGIVTDNSKITRVEFRNLNREIIGDASVSGTNWQANIWLFTGENSIGLTAYDDEGNATVLGTIVDCTGEGCGNGGAATPSLIPISDRTIEAGQLFELAVSAVSPTEPSVLTYWAANLPDTAEFDPVIQKFSWIPASEGVYSDITFYVTDGTHVDSNKLTLTVTSTPSVNIISVDLPDAYVDYPYYFHLSDDSINGPVTWEIDNADMPPGLFASRSGIICGTPYNTTSERTVNFTAKAISVDGIESKTRQFSLYIATSDPSSLFKIFTKEIPYKLNGAEYDVQLVATNGSLPYTWVDIAGMLQSASSLTVSSNGLLSGTANANGVVPVTWYVEDISNKSTYATIPVPIIKGENYLLKLDGNKNKCKIIIKRVPGKTSKCKMMVTAFLKLPEAFEIDENSIVTLKVGYGFIDARLPSHKYVLEKKLLYKNKAGLQTSKILVKKLPDGRISAKFIIKNVDYNGTFNEYGIVDETLKLGQTTLPFWIRIGDYCTETTEINVTVKSKAGKFTKCNAKW